MSVSRNHSTKIIVRGTVSVCCNGITVAQLLCTATALDVELRAPEDKDSHHCDRRRRQRHHPNIKRVFASMGTRVLLLLRCWKQLMRPNKSTV